MTRRRIPLCALALLLCAPVIARGDQIDDFIKAEMKRLNIPGFSHAVVKDGRIVKARRASCAKRPAWIRSTLKVMQL